MKKTIFFTLMFATGQFINAQVSLQHSGQSASGQLFFTKSKDNTSQAVAGTPYINEKFELANVNGGKALFDIRFNAYKNIMEYTETSEILHLVKEQNTEFYFPKSKVKYILKNIEKDGKTQQKYVRIIFEGKNTAISVLEEVRLRPARPAANSYDRPTPATYVREDDTFFITLDGKNIEIPSRESRFLKLFEDKIKRTKIEKFIDDNDLDLDEEKDLIQIGQFIDSL